MQTNPVIPYQAALSPIKIRHSRARGNPTPDSDFLRNGNDANRMAVRLSAGPFDPRPRGNDEEFWESIKDTAALPLHRAISCHKSADGSRPGYGTVPNLFCLHIQ